MANAAKDENGVSTLIGVSSADSVTPTRVAVDPITGRLLVTMIGGSGTLTAETPNGTVDDSNTSFTVSNTPLFVVVNGGTYQAGQGIFASYAGGTITLNSPVGAGGFITSYYLA